MMNDVLKVPEKTPEQNVEKSVEKRRLFIGDRRSHQHRRLKNISTQNIFIPNPSLLLFFSLDRPVTNNQILNSKYQPMFFCCRFNSKKDSLVSSLFEMKQQQKIVVDIWCEVFGF